MTQQEFARRVGVTQSHLSALERGDNEPCRDVRTLLPLLILGYVAFALARVTCYVV